MQIRWYSISEITSTCNPALECPIDMYRTLRLWVYLLSHPYQLYSSQNVQTTLHPSQCMLPQNRNLRHEWRCFWYVIRQLEMHHLLERVRLRRSSQRSKLQQEAHLPLGMPCVKNVKNELPAVQGDRQMKWTYSQILKEAIEAQMPTALRIK